MHTFYHQVLLLLLNPLRKARWIMKKLYTTSIWGVCLALMLIFKTSHVQASHAQGADISYQCLGGNTYQITVSFYRDCAGVGAPGSVTVDINSASCGENFSATLIPVAGTGQEVTSICASMNTTCSGGTYPGVQEYQYTGTVTLPAACSDWVFSFSLCCRNAAISTITTPGSEDIYVEAHLDNLNYPCNNSPVFSNPPVPFICVGQTYCFNHGATDADGDSLVYNLIDPMTSASTTVSYLPGYTSGQPLNSLPAVTIDPLTGDICMTPQMLEVTVMAVLVEEYRDGVLIGSVVRDIQVRVIACSNTLPALSGINGTSLYQTSVCVGNTLTFTILSADEDPGQIISINWNGGIPAGTFTSAGSPYPVGTFTWTPTAADISTVPYCFTVTVTDDACPFNGTQTFSYCITVTGFDVTVTTNDANCGASNGSASATVSGGTAPYTYDWSEGSTMAFQNGLAAGTYSVTVSDASGCSITSNFTIGSGTVPGNLILNGTDVACYGDATGAITASLAGPSSISTYDWSTGSSAAALSGLPAGTYWLTVTTAAGCTITDTIVLTQPASPLAATITKSDISCNAANDGTATVNVSGGTAPYVYTWTTGATTATVTGLNPGSHSCAIVDDNGCGLYMTTSIIEPAAIQVNSTTITNVSCNGMNDGSSTVNVSGGTGALTVQWTTVPVQFGTTAVSLGPGTIGFSVTDANGCFIHSTVPITEPAPLNLVINSTNIICYDDNNGTIHPVVSGGTGPYTILLNGSSVPNNITQTGLSDGLYTINVTDANGCTTNQNLTLTQPAPVTLMTAPNDTICPGEYITVYAYATGGSGVYHYNWNHGLGDNSSFVVSPAANTSYTVTVIDENGCSSPSTTTMVTVNDINLIDLTLNGSAAVCQGDTVFFSASLTGGIGAYTLNWNSGMFTGYGPHTYVPTADGTMTVTVTDVCGNSVVETINYNVNPLPMVQLLPLTSSHCGYVQTSFENQYVNQPGEVYNWTIDGNTIIGNTITYLFNESGIYPVTLTVTNAYGCSASSTANATIEVYPQTEAVIDATPHETDEFHPVIQFINASLYATSYDWEFGDGSTSDEYQPSHSYEGAGTYTVTMITNNQYGCADTVTLDVIVHPEYTLYIPNAFTPDGDGINDILFAYGTHIKEFEMMIFNRWGEAIFKSNGLEQGWDGIHNGYMAKEDVYVYKIKYKTNRDEVLTREGHISLLK